MIREQGRETRRRLLEAAVTLIGEAGWNGVTTRMVAERAGVAPGVVHYHYASVTDLLVAASCAFAERLLDELARHLAAHPDLDGGLTWLLGQVAAYDGADPASLLMTETYLAAQRLPDLHGRLRGTVVRFRREVSTWLQVVGREAPETDAGAAAAADARAVLLAAVVDGLVLQRGLDPGVDVAALAGPLRAMLRGENAP
ncbi:TetR family transcriptional regulator [Streptosporangium violaceochromogenes]|nr:TetR family transcriptional regulator [Streptosporangium violaceochromogenes]